MIIIIIMNISKNYNRIILNVKMKMMKKIRRRKYYIKLNKIEELYEI